MISEEQKNEIVTMWKNGSNISEIHRASGVSRPTVRKVVTEYDANRKWRLTRMEKEDGVIRFVIKTFQLKWKEGTAMQRLEAGVWFGDVDGLLGSFIKRETVDEIMTEFNSTRAELNVLDINESELIPRIMMG